MIAPPRALPALITPFDEAGDLDLEAHRHNLSLLWSRGVRGFLVGGSNGEGPYLETGERHALIASARATVPDAFLLAGLAAESVRLAREQAAEANGAGADALLALCPTTLARGDAAAVQRYYTALAQEAPLPVLLYSMPRYTAYEIPPEVVVATAAEPGIVGMKDSGGEVARLATLATALPRGFLLFAGRAGVLAAACRAGAYGAICAAANYAPGLVQRTVASGRGDDAAQAVLARLAAAVECYGIAGVKAAAEAAGLRAGPPRRPLLPVDPAERAAIAAALAATLEPPGPAE